MKNITVSVHDEIYRRARVRAAERDTSVSALVRGFLEGLGGEASEFERLAKEEKTLRSKIERFSAARRLSRDEAHRRG